MMGMCRTCSYLIEHRMREHRETLEEAIDYFEKSNVLEQLRQLRAEAEGRSLNLDIDRGEVTTDAA